jgi:hypothetical protein
MSRDVEYFNLKITSNQRRLVLHSLFWVAWLSRTLYDIIRIFGIESAFLFSFTYIFTQMPFVYLHLYVLVPKYLNTKKYAQYLILTISSLFVYSYFNYFVLHQLPLSWITLKMSYYINTLAPLYDVLEGLFAFVITYALKYTWLAISTQNKILVFETSITDYTLSNADEVFLSNSINGVQWVGQYKQKYYTNKMAVFFNEKLNTLAMER